MPEFFSIVSVFSNTKVAVWFAFGVFNCLLVGLVLLVSRLHENIVRNPWVSYPTQTGDPNDILYFYTLESYTKI